ncbi:recombinase family protein [Listeria monocytogenes]|uniref:Recombinase family protein n=1 Tax=Listeria monocytogenes TaxID=1639 RepID=A0A6C8NEL4_LISMN|nr:recombinase family protein [Listeria monocytogenes]EBF5285198.1 recombinase family protein [Listeria monocytogenes]KAA9596207.1 hypothetical protein DCK14_05335 [Listeria monocytogenes]
MKTFRVVIYTRVSTTLQVEKGNSLNAQEKTLSEYAKARGWEVIKIYTDKGVSAKSNDRPAFNELMSDLKENKFDVVLIWKLSRFSRNAKNLLFDCAELEKYDVCLASYSEQFDCTTAAGRLMRNILGVIAEFEREVIRENSKEVKLFKVQSGCRTAAFALGYMLNTANKEFIIKESEAKIVRFLFDAYKKTSSLTETAKLANSKGYKGKRGASFRPSSVKVVLTNPLYCGYNSYDTLVIKGHTPALISKREYNNVQNILKLNGNKNQKKSYKLLTKKASMDSDYVIML